MRSVLSAGGVLRTEVRAPGSGREEVDGWGGGGFHFGEVPGGAGGLGADGVDGGAAFGAVEGDLDIGGAIAVVPVDAAGEPEAEGDGFAELGAHFRGGLGGVEGELEGFGFADAGEDEVDDAADKEEDHEGEASAAAAAVEDAFADGGAVFARGAVGVAEGVFGRGEGGRVHGRFGGLANGSHG